MYIENSIKNIENETTGIKEILNDIAEKITPATLLDGDTWVKEILYSMDQLAEICQVNKKTITQNIKKHNMEYKYKGNKIVIDFKTAQRLIRHYASKKSLRNV